jgi:hypothetical protein
LLNLAKCSRTKKSKRVEKAKRKERREKRIQKTAYVIIQRLGLRTAEPPGAVANVTCKKLRGSKRWARK